VLGGINMNAKLFDLLGFRYEMRVSFDPLGGDRIVSVYDTKNNNQFNIRITPMQIIHADVDILILVVKECIDALIKLEGRKDEENKSI
jgi:hypothetical protein